MWDAIGAGYHLRVQGDTQIDRQPTRTRRYTTALLVIAGIAFATLMLALGYSWQVVVAVLVVFIVVAALGVWVPRRIRSRRARTATTPGA